MDYGIGIPSYIDAWREVKAAEDAGFTHAWFFDSQLIYSDVWATMALAAQNTSRIKLGTLVAIPSNRLAPVTAAAAASINKIAPGRVIVGLGTGYTGRNTMGLPALTMDAFEEYARQVKGLLNGEDVLLREGRPRAVDTSDTLQIQLRARRILQYRRPHSRDARRERSARSEDNGRNIRRLDNDRAKRFRAGRSAPRDGGGGSDRQQFRPVRRRRRKAVCYRAHDLVRS